MSRRYLALVLGMVWIHCGCEFRDESKAAPVAELRTDLTFAWGDPSGSHEILRSFENSKSGLVNAPPLPMVVAPENLTIQGFEPGSGGCVAKLWVRAETPVKLDCVGVEGSKELTLRGLNLAVPPNLDGLHPLRIEVGATSINLGIRTLPSALPLSRSERSISARSVGTTSNYHQVAAFEIARSSAGGMTLSMPTKVSGIVRRKLVRFGYNFDFFRCEVGPTTTREDEDIAVEIYLVPDVAGVERDWPQSFSLDSQLVTIPKEKSARVLGFVANPFLDKVFGPSEYKERSFMATETEMCRDLTSGPNPIPSRVVAMIGGISETTFSVREGRDESDPLLIFTISGLQAFDAQSFEIDKKPVSSSISAQSFELTLSKDLP